MSSNTTSIYPDNDTMDVVEHTNDIENIVSSPVSNSIYGKENIIIIDDSDDDEVEEDVPQSINNRIQNINTSGDVSYTTSLQNQLNEVDDQKMEINEYNDQQNDGHSEEEEEEDSSSDHSDDNGDYDDDFDNDSESSSVSEAYTDSTTDSQGRFGSMQIASYRKRHFFLCNAFGCRLVLKALQVTISLYMYYTFLFIYLLSWFAE